MCDFFSFVTAGAGNYFYADWELREKHLKVTKNNLKRLPECRIDFPGIIRMVGEE